MSFIARLLRRPAVGPAAAITAPAAPNDASEPLASAAPAPTPPAPVQTGAACPSCGTLLVPPPARTRRCPRCRQTIVVRRTVGRTIYLTEAAVEVFEAQRRHESDVVTWTAARREWLRLARGVGAPEDRRRRIEAHAVTLEGVEEAKALYLSAAAKAAHAAKTAKDWNAVARILGERASALYREAGSPVPPTDEIVAIHADAMTALLRSLRGTGTHAEVVGSACCRGCRTDDGRAFAIADELRTPRLPHPGCPRGLCPCEWFVAGTPKKRRTRRKRPPPP